MEWNLGVSKFQICPLAWLGPSGLRFARQRDLGFGTSYKISKLEMEQMECGAHSQGSLGDTEGFVKNVT